MRAEFEISDAEEKTKREKDATSKPKLPKLKITKSKGTHLEWMQFWGQFEIEVDRLSLTPLTKLSYLKEFVDPKVMERLLMVCHLI